MIKSSLKKQVDIYLKRMNLELSDVYLLDVKGKTINVNDLNENALEAKYFLFNKTFQKEQMLKIYEENVDKMTSISSLDVNLPSLCVDLSFIENNPKLANLLQQTDIKLINEQLQEVSNITKETHISIKGSMKIAEKTKENYGYQYNSLECVYKNISFLYEQSHLKHRELENELTKQSEKNDRILRVFKESIDKLKQIELHPKMQTTKEKNLIDIYFDESKMNIWRDKCVKQADFISMKIKSKGEAILTEKAKIRNEKNTQILQLKNDWTTHNVEYDTLITEKESTSNALVNSITEDIKSFNKAVSLLFEGNEAQIEEALPILKQLKAKYITNSFLKEVILLQQYSTTLKEFIKKMQNLLAKSCIKINVIFTNYHQIKKVLIEIIDKLDKYSVGLTSLEKDFSYLQNPYYFPQAYQSSILEIKRRIIFNKKIMKDFERLKQLIVKENLNRKQFIQDYGKYLTHDYVPQLKFSDLKLTIELNNNNELSNLPNLLDEEEESMVNNSNLYLEYEETLNSNENNLIHSNQNIKRKLSCDNVDMYEDKIRGLQAELSEMEIVSKVKESEIKKLLTKLEQRDRKITYMQSEMDKLTHTIDSLSENFLKQLVYKDHKIKEKTIECENLLRVINTNTYNKLDNCPMCKELSLNSIDYQGWANFVRDYHDKMVIVNKNSAKLEARYQELVVQTNFIKKTYFTHYNTTLAEKMQEHMSFKQNYETKLMHVEDLLSQERSKHENGNCSVGKKKIEEDIMNLNKKIQTYESKLKDYSKLLMSNDTENKKLKSEREVLKKTTDELKAKENTLLVELKLKETKLENLQSELLSLEKQYDLHKKKYNQVSEEIVQYIKEITNLKCNLDNRGKIIEDLQKDLENSKINHIETLNEVHKANHIIIEKLNGKIDELTQVINDKTKEIEELLCAKENLQMSLHRKKEELKEALLNHEKTLDELKSTNEESQLYQNECTVLKKKLDDMQIVMDKKLNEFSEITKFFSTTDANFNNCIMSYNTKNNSSDNNSMLTMAITNHLTKFTESDELVNIKRLEKGMRTIFIPHSNGIYVSLNLNSMAIDMTNNFEGNYETNKYFQCNSILNLESVEDNLRELLMENMLIIIGKVGKVTEHTPTCEVNPYGLPEDTTYTLLSLDKIDYVIGFQGDELIFRNYLF